VKFRVDFYLGEMPVNQIIVEGSRLDLKINPSASFDRLSVELEDTPVDTMVARLLDGQPALEAPATSKARAESSSE
jgi:hypothetical protein